VYKGLWKGSVVAVKTIVLPAMMSGAEKREKMVSIAGSCGDCACQKASPSFIRAPLSPWLITSSWFASDPHPHPHPAPRTPMCNQAIMEAAISSALSHPNILQTYTYDIRPLRDNAGAGSKKLMMGMSTTLGPSTSVAGSDGGGGSVHSFEVRLVLEYCDKGSLREALDQGAFLLAPGSSDGAAATTAVSSPGAVGGGAPPVNYRAVLDTAIEVATAMVHLHGRNVLHADLKVGRLVLVGLVGWLWFWFACKVLHVA